MPHSRVAAETGEAEILMPWTYQQRNGQLLKPTGDLVGTGYSGYPPHVNIAADEALEGLGPIPAGLWEMVSVIPEHPKLGPFVIVLRPDESTRVKVEAMPRDADSFRLHGERVEPPAGFASEGCIVQNRTVRMLAWASTDRWIEVVQGPDPAEPSPS